MVVGVVFDLFETLVTEGPVWRARAGGVERSWQIEAAVSLGVSAELFGRVWEGLKNARMMSVIPFDEVLRRVCVEAGVVADEQIIAGLDRRRRASKAACFEALDEGVIDMLDALASTGVRLAILSNCSGEELDSLDSSAIGRLVKHVSSLVRSATRNLPLRRTELPAPAFSFRRRSASLSATDPSTSSRVLVERGCGRSGLGSS